MLFVSTEKKGSHHLQGNVNGVFHVRIPEAGKACFWHLRKLRIDGLPGYVIPIQTKPSQQKSIHPPSWLSLSLGLSQRPKDRAEVSHAPAPLCQVGEDTLHLQPQRVDWTRPSLHPTAPAPKKGKILGSTRFLTVQVRAVFVLEGPLYFIEFS